jgi:hypothetical protein
MNGIRLIRKVSDIPRYHQFVSQVWCQLTNYDHGHRELNRRALVSFFKQSMLVAMYDEYAVVGLGTLTAVQHLNGSHFGIIQTFYVESKWGNVARRRDACDEMLEYLIGEANHVVMEHLEVRFARRWQLIENSFRRMGFEIAGSIGWLNLKK